MAVNIKPSAPSDTKAKPKAGWMKSGATAKAAIQKEEAEAEARKNSRHQTYNFYLKENEERTITFLDGELDEDGLFKNPFYSQHGVFKDGRWTDFPCVGENEACPLCEMSQNQKNKVGYATFVALFTVIDHTEVKSGDRVYQHQIRKFVAKRNTIKQLEKHAKAHGGSLAGVTFKVSRSSDKAPNVGDIFIFDQKNEMDDIVSTFEERNEKGEITKKIAPLDYEKEVVYYTASELKKLGFGGTPSFGGDSGMVGHAQPGAGGTGVSKEDL